MPLLSEVRAMVEPDRVLVIGRATYERWLGIEPHEIDAAATALRQVEPQHALLSDLETRARRARQLKRFLETAVAAVARNAA
jgi:hypothetical protein